MKMPLATEKSPLTHESQNGILLHERVEDLGEFKMGPFTRLPDCGIVTVEETDCCISRDEGKTWESFPLFEPDAGISVRPERAVHCTREGTLLLAFENEQERRFTWQDDLQDAPEARLPTYAMRSEDGGRTWIGRRKLHDDWTGAIRDMIETRAGHVIFTAMKLRHNPGHHTVMTYTSSDQGRSWLPSNVLDLGGIGHHGGISEATLVERRDGALLKLIRTNWGQFWWAVSTDDGLFWHAIGPSGIPASNAPGMLKRLYSGRIALVWNRPLPEGATSFPLRGGDGIWSATPVSNHRAELSISFSSDDCETWTPPVVLARKEETSLAYPYLFEAEPGVLWLTTMQGGLRVRLKEKDFKNS